MFPLRASNYSWLAILGCSALLGCAPAEIDLENIDDIPVADALDTDEKADGIASTSPQVLKLLDGATTRFYGKINGLADRTLLQHLVTAAKRGVDVEVYTVAKTPGHPATVLAAEGLEAAGVDVCTDRSDHLTGFYAVADDQVLVKKGTSTSVSTTAKTVAKAAAAFSAANSEESDTTVADLPASKLKLMQMPESTGAQIMALIARESTSIDLEIYQLQDIPVIDALAAAAKRGVAVRVMLEPHTVGAANFTAASKVLSDAGVQVKATPPAFDAHHNVDHAKFMVLGGNELVFGSGNLVRSGLGGNRAEEFDNRDFWIRDRRPFAVAEAAQLFTADWNRASTTGMAFQALVLTPDNANDRVLQLINGASTRLFVYNQSLNSKPIVDALVAAKKTRGVDVHVLLGMQPGFGGAPPANQAAIDTLTAAKIPAQFFTKHYLHGKMIVADDAVFIGSQNFTGGGLGNNRELGEVFDDATIVDAAARTFTGDEADPAP